MNSVSVFLLSAGEQKDKRGYVGPQRDLTPKVILVALKVVAGVKARGCPIGRTVIFPCELLYEFLVLVELFEVVTRHSIGAMVLCAVDIVLITQNTIMRGLQSEMLSKRGADRSTYQMLTLGRGTTGSLMVPELFI